MIKMRNILIKSLLIFSVIFFTACMSTKTFTQVVQSKIGNDTLEVERVDTGYITFKTDKLPVLDSTIRVRKIQSHFIPALLYWEKENSMTCEINSNYFTNVFLDVLNRTSQEFLLKKHLGDKKIEINLEVIPSGFKYSDKFVAFFAFFFSGYGSLENIRSFQGNMKVTYRILDGNNEVKTNTLTETVVEPITNADASHSEFVEDYIDFLKRSYKQQSEKIILQIIDDIY